jgi:hypothetical protein
MKDYAMPLRRDPLFCEFEMTLCLHQRKTETAHWPPQLKLNLVDLSALSAPHFVSIAADPSWPMLGGFAGSSKASK